MAYCLLDLIGEFGVKVADVIFILLLTVYPIVTT